MPRHLAIPVLILTWAACAESPTPLPPDPAPSPPVSRPTPTWLRVEGTRLVNEAGQTVVLKGLFLSNNIWGNWIWPESADRERRGEPSLIPPTEQDAWVLTDADFAVFSTLHLNNVVYALNYELFTEDNPRRAANLDRLVGHVDRFGTMGIYVTLIFAGAPGLNVNTSGFYSRRPGSERPPTVFEDRTTQDLHAGFIRTVVEAVKNRPAVAGYILIDEPFAPASVDGGIAAFRAGNERFCRDIREIDPRHVIFVQGYNGREADPGERFWNGAGFEIDTGQQAYTGPPAIIGLDPTIPGVAYDIHAFVPYAFTSEGAADFSRGEIDAAIDGWVGRANGELRAPLVISSYGVDTRQPPARRIAWLDAIHGSFERYGLSVSYFHYKDRINCQSGDVGFGVFRQCGDAVPNPWDPGVVEAFQRYWRR